MPANSLFDFFKQDGPLSTIITGYQPREAQITMAEAIYKTILEHDSLVIEAGTGIGKTFAYLVPALLSDSKVLVSTGTKHLQDQIYEKDLPLLKKIIKHKPITTALLKGRNNYLCLYRIKTLRQRGRFENKQQVNDFYKIERYAGQDTVGDITQIAGVNESTLWPHVTSTTENCLHNECPDYQDCFIVKARKKALDANLVIINHHLLCADLALKQEGFGEILPAAEVIIIDEAHQLAETAGLFFSTQISTKEFIDWLDDFEKAISLEASDFKDHETFAHLIIKHINDTRMLLPEGNKRHALSMFKTNSAIMELIKSISDNVVQLLKHLNPLVARSTIFGKLFERLETWAKDWHALTINALDNPEDNVIVWLETYTHHFSIHATPLDIADIFKHNQSALKASWIYTSATLAVDKDFHYFCEPLGLSVEKTLQLESPFDYPRISLFYHPPNLPDPNHTDYISKFIEEMLPVIHAAKGRTFILFTSYRALNEAVILLKEKISYPLFIQGDLPKLALIDAFKASNNGVLLGTTSFWEGVDVRGDALSCVIIEKLPFASPNDPIEQARIDLLTHQGKNAFLHYQLPKSIIALKQGVGRLIRDPSDFGLLVIADPRLIQKGYGKKFLKSLPPMTRTQKLDRVINFFEYIKQKRLECPR